MTDGMLVVNFSALQQAGADIHKALNNLQSQLAQLESDAKPLVDTWAVRGSPEALIFSSARQLNALAQAGHPEGVTALSAWLAVPALNKVGVDQTDSLRPRGRRARRRPGLRAAPGSETPVGYAGGHIGDRSPLDQRVSGCRRSAVLLRW